MSRKTKAEKHLRRSRKGKRRNPLTLPPGFKPYPMHGAPADFMLDGAIDLMLMSVLRTSGIRDIIKKAILSAPPKEDADEPPATVN